MGVRDNIEHIDTNIIIRLITRDDEKMLKKVKKLISQEEKIFIFEDAAMMEVVYVLSTSLYYYSRELIAQKIKEIMLIDNIIFNKGLIEDALNLYVSRPKLSFVDCYLAAITTISGQSPLWTFDRKLAAGCPVAKLL